MTATILHVNFATGRLEKVETSSGVFTRIEEPTPAPAPVKTPSYVPAYCDPDNEFRGSRYDETKRLDIAEIAKLVRADIKAARKSGKLPKKGLKTSVRISRYSGGQSLGIQVKATPFPVMNPEYLAWLATPEAAWERRPAGMSCHTAEADSLLETLKGILQSYNRDNSDTMTDYFDVRFYGDADFSYDLERAERDAFTAANS